MNDFKVICFKLAFLLMTAKYLICFSSSADYSPAVARTTASICQAYSYIIAYKIQLKLLLWSGLELSSDNCNYRSAVMKFITANQYNLPPTEQPQKR